MIAVYDKYGSLLLYVAFSHTAAAVSVLVGKPVKWSSMFGPYAWVCK